jgi:stress response protein YsnF
VTQTDPRVAECIGQDLIGGDGERIGEINDIYMDEETGQPEWFAVRTGWFGKRLSFVPIQGANWTESAISVSYDKAQVKNAPHAEPDGQLSQDEEAALYAHYGIAYGESRSSSGLPEGGKRQDSSAKQGDDEAMTRSEEELVTGTRTQEAGRVRLVKYVETEHVNVTIPVRREKARVVTEPITDENRSDAMDGPEITEKVHEETLYEEEPVVGTRTVPKERVRLEKDTVTEERDVGADVRKERIDVDGPAEGRT